jgi:hypothetical protein
MPAAAWLMNLGFAAGTAAVVEEYAYIRRGPSEDDTLLRRLSPIDTDHLRRGPSADHERIRRP